MSKRFIVLAALVGFCVSATPSGASVSVGDGHVLVVASDGTVWAWGQNDSGQLGIGSTGGKTVPTQVTGLTGVTVVSAGSQHSLALKSDGTVWAWGANYSGQLGVDQSIAQENAPVQVSGLTGIVTIAAGNSHSLALKSDGTVWAWGANWAGQLGNNSTTASSTPVQVSGLTNITAIAAGYGHGLARGIDGVLHVWGWNAYGQLGNGNYDPQTTPLSLSTITDVSAIAAGQTFSIVVKSDGTVWAWGANGNGQLGNGSTTGRNLPGQVSTLTNIVSVAGGGSHALALSTTGGVYAWGANWQGQIGDGSGQDAHTPVAVSSVPAAQAIAAGYAFTLALTTDNQVFAWGANYSGQLGDGTNATAVTPIAISASGFVWCVGAPTFTLTSGTYQPDQIVTVASATDGATIHYTTDGTDPTESSSALASGGTLTLRDSVTVRAQAYKSGWPPSHVAVVAYTFQVATPQLTPPSGTYGDPQTVSINSSTSGATLRYTTDGSDPTDSSTIYNAPITISQNTTLQVKGYRSGVLSSDTVQAVYVLQVREPSISPRSGLYTTAPAVTITADAGTSIHYTTDGSDPTEASTLYTAPIPTTTAGDTIRAKAFRTGWTPSTTASATYATGTDTTAPTITARIEPAPNTAGWSHTPVTVFFDCQDDFADPLTCSAPVTLSSEGAGQVVSGSVQDGSGHTAAVSVTVNLDLTPATVTLSAPTDASTTSASSVTVSGVVSDALSGIDSVRCNAVVVTLASDGSFSCDTPVGKGRNTIVVQLFDTAGNNTSTSLHLTRTGAPTSLSVSPATRTLVVGQQKPLQALDDFGTTPDGLTWASSDTTIATVDATAGTVQAVAPGVATITASVGSLSAQSTITVAAGSLVIEGTALWTSTPVIATAPADSVYARRVGVDSPDMYVLETDGNTQLLRGLADGAEVSREVLPIMGWQNNITQFAGDQFGGVLLGVNNYGCSGRGCNSIIRAGGGTASAWQYNGDWLSTFAQSNSGDVYVFETIQGPGDYRNNIHYFTSWTTLVRLDGRTGAVLARMSLPRSHGEGLHCEYSSVGDGSAAHGPLVIGADDAVYALLQPEYSVSDFQQCTVRRWQDDRTLQLMRVSPDTNEATFTTLDHFSDSGSGDMTNLGPTWPGHLMPTDQGGFLASGSDFGYGQAHQSYVTTTGLQQLPVDFSGSMLIGRDGIAFGTIGEGTQSAAVDLASNTLLWTNSAGRPVATLEDGGVAVQNIETNTLYVLNSSGAPTASGSLPNLGMGDPEYFGLGEWHVKGSDGLPNGYASLDVSEARYYYGESGDSQRQKHPHMPTFLTLNPTDPDTNFPSTAVLTRLVNTPGLSLHEVDHDVLIGDAITAKNLLAAVKKPYDAVGYIGHSVLPDANLQAGGLILAGNFLLVLDTPQRRAAFPAEVTTFVPHIDVASKIIFAAACGISTEFQQLWNVSGTTEGHVLVASNTQKTRLGIGMEAWRLFLQQLAQGKRVNAAVKQVNLQILQGMQAPNGWGKNDDQQYEQWTITGADPCGYVRKTAATGKDENCDATMDVLAWKPPQP
jgi:alpha-tubulin suppressor-like RCC1 family protein